MADAFASHSAAISGPATGGFAITKSDATVFSQPTRTIRVGGAGDVAVLMLDGTTFTIPAVLAGEWLDIRVTKVLSTGTTATNMTGFY